MTKLEKIIYDALKEKQELDKQAEKIYHAVLPLIGSAFDAGMKRRLTKNKYEWLSENIKKETE